MTSTRAEDVAEVLWELKKADKFATLHAIASRAGFSGGSNGRAIRTAMKTVRRDWPHLQWWRAISDEEGMLENDEQSVQLADAGHEITKTKEGPKLKGFKSLQMVWEDPDATDDADESQVEAAAGDE